MNRILKIRCYSLAAAAAGLLIAALSAAPAAPPDLDAWIARAMRTFEVPGIGLATSKTMPW